jgi:hypothetical protein
MFVGGTDASKQYRSPPFEDVIVGFATEDVDIEAVRLEMRDGALLFPRQTARTAFHLDECVTFGSPFRAERALSVAEREEVGDARESARLTRDGVGDLGIETDQSGLTVLEFDVALVAPVGEILLELASRGLVLGGSFARLRYAAVLSESPSARFDTESTHGSVFGERWEGSRQAVGDAHAFTHVSAVDDALRHRLRERVTEAVVGPRLNIDDGPAPTRSGVDVSALGALGAREFACVVVTDKVTRFRERRYIRDGGILDGVEFVRDRSRETVGFFDGWTADDELTPLVIRAHLNDSARAYSVDTVDVAGEAE